MSKRNSSHKKGRKTSNKDKRKELKKQTYANMRESARNSENISMDDTGVKRGRLATGSTRYCRHPEKNRRIQNSVLSRVEWNKLTPIQQLHELDLRLGFNTGASKQRLRLRALIAM